MMRARARTNTHAYAPRRVSFSNNINFCAIEGAPLFAIIRFLIKRQRVIQLKFAGIAGD